MDRLQETELLEQNGEMAGKHSSVVGSGGLMNRLARARVGS